MTTIAWDGQTLAADRMASIGNSKSVCIKKIHELKGGGYAAAAGHAGAGALMFRWLDHEAVVGDYPLTDPELCTVIVITEDGQLLQYDGPLPVKLDAPFYAIGSGRDFALAALHLGKSAKEAVEIASELDQSTGNGIDVVMLPVKGVIK